MRTFNVKIQLMLNAFSAAMHPACLIPFRGHKIPNSQSKQCPKVLQSLKTKSKKIYEEQHKLK